MNHNVATFSKATATDVVFAVTSDNAVVCTELKNNLSTVNPDNYSFVNNELIIKKEYLSGLANGDKKFTLTLNTGNSFVLSISVSD